MSPCITLPDGGAPDLALEYESAFLKDGFEVVNMSVLHLEPDQTGTWSLYCLAPVALGDLYFEGDVVLLVLARSEDNVVVAAAQEELSLKNVTAAVQQEGPETLSVRWNQEPGRNYLVQIWAVPSPARGHAPLATTSIGESRTETPEVVDVSGNVRCKNGSCSYYFLGLVEYGEYAAEVLDVTDPIIQTSRSRRQSVERHWTGLAVESVVIETTSPSSERPLKTLTTTATADEGLGVEEEGFRGVLINALDPSDVLESGEGDCLPFTNGCKIKNVQSLTYPNGEGQVKDLQLLLTQLDPGISSLVPVTDLHIRVSNVGPGSVQVSWDKTAVPLQFLVEVLPDKGGSAIAQDVTCGLEAPDCHAVFDQLFNGDYTARVSYEGALQTTLTVPFQVKDGADCQLPFEVLAGRCVLVDAVISGTWDEMKLFCHQLGGQLAKVDQLEFMYHLVKYIRDNGIDDNNYWIGGSETATEGEFLWLDGDKVRQGTPYWSYESGAQRPVSDSSLRCIAMGQSVFYYFIDSLCNESYAAVCEKLA